MRITSTGNVGIGTTTPASTLDVSTTIRVTGDAVTRYGLITQYLDSTYIDAFGTGANTGEILFRTNDGSVSTLSLKANGNVGIGTTTPANLLDIAAPLGSGFGFDSPGQLPTLKFYRYAGGASTIGAYQLVVGETGASAGSDLSFKSGGYAARGSETLTTKVTFTNTGNVGIGTTSPTAKLQVAGDALINTLTVGLGAGSIATNTAVGNNALVANTTGANNTSVGYNALMRNSTGGSNTAIGYAAGYYYNGTTGNNLTPSNSVYIGNGTSPLADAQTNQIVIGDSAIGAGSNTVTLGNTSIVTTVLRGNVTATAGSLALKIPTTVATSTYTMTSTDSTLIFTGGACTVTLLAAATYPGRIINITNAAAGTIISATSNVVPGGSVTAGTALLSNAPGHFTWLQSDGTNWITIMTGSGN